jgi:hypothetical protein
LTGDNRTLSQATIHLDGNSGDIVLANADCAEDFEVEDPTGTEPGTVMVISDESRLRASERAYDRRVAGVIAGAGDQRPGIVLGRGRGGVARLVGLAVPAVARRRGRIRRWVRLRQSMLHDVATVPATYLVQISSRPDATVGGRTQAVDLFTGACGTVWLPASVATGTVVCFSEAARGPWVRAWMTGAV